MDIEKVIAIIVIVSVVLMTLWNKQAKKKSNIPKITILYGTQTGNASIYTEKLKTILYEEFGKNISIVVDNIETYNYESKLSEENIVFFIISTYGEGEPPDSCVEFNAWLSEANDKAEKIFKSIKFSLFALGSTEYITYCAFGRKVEKIMNDLGARIIAPRGEGDDSKNGLTDDRFENWAKSLKKMLKENI